MSNNLKMEIFEIHLIAKIVNIMGISGFLFFQKKKTTKFIAKIWSVHHIAIFFCCNLFVSEQVGGKT